MISRSILSVTALAFCVALGTGCRKRAELEYQNEQLQLALSDQRAALKRLETELAALPNLGRYSQVPRSQIPELKNRIQGIKADTARLDAEKEALRLVVERLQKELDDYQAKFAGR